MGGSAIYSHTLHFMSKSYQHIFFDLDHTLWDFDRNSAATLTKLYDEYALEEKGVADLNEFIEVYAAHNQKLWDRFRNGYIRRDELRWKRFWHTLLDFKVVTDTLAYELSSAYSEILPTQNLLTDHAQVLLDYCKEKYTLHLITNGHDLTQKMKLQYSGISKYFSEIITSEKSFAMKPHSKIFEYALSATGANKDNCIMIGDSLEVDILGAQNAGWDAIYYNPKQKKHSEKPTHEIKCLSELMSIL